MQRIPIRLAEPGMVLAEPVLSASGITLAGPGIELTEAVIQRIVNTGASSIVVEGSAGEGSGKDLQRVLSSLEYNFRRHRSDVFMMTLRNVLFGYLNRRVTDEEKLAGEYRAALEARRSAQEAAAGGAGSGGSETTAGSGG